MMIVIKRLFAYPRTIREILRTSEYESAPPEVIMAIWNSFHDQNPQTVAKVLSKVQYQIILNRLDECPSFVFPTKIENTDITLLLEVLEDNTYGFSNIEDNEGELIMNVRMFDEIAESKNIVPVRGDLTCEGLEKKDADVVLQAFTKYYLDTDLFEKYVAAFNQDFENFDYHKFLQEYFEMNGGQ